MPKVEVKRQQTITRFSVYKWGVYVNGELFEGFRTRDDAERAAEQLRREIR